MDKFPLLLAALFYISTWSAVANPDQPTYWIIRTAEEPDPKANESRKRLIEKLNSTVIPLLDFNQTPLTVAISLLETKTQGIPIILSSSTGIKPVNRQTNPPTKIIPVKEKEITLTLQNTSLAEALTAVGNQANLTYFVSSDAINFIASTTPEIETVSYRYQITLPIFQKVLQQLPTGNYIQPTFENLGVDFSTGTHAKFNYHDLNLRVTNSPDQIEAIEKILESVSGGKVIPAQDFTSNKSKTITSWNIALLFILLILLFVIFWYLKRR